MTERDLRCNGTSYSTRDGYRSFLNVDHCTPHQQRQLIAKEKIAK
jgi:hypothetical protein